MTAVQSTFSPSSLNCFDNCPKQYHFRYVEKIQVETEGVEAFVGKRVHEILERLYTFVADGKVPSLERVLHRFHENWEAQFDAERIRIVRSGMEPTDYRQSGVRCWRTRRRARPCAQRPRPTNRSKDRSRARAQRARPRS